MLQKCFKKHKKSYTQEKINIYRERDIQRECIIGSIDMDIGILPLSKNQDHQYDKADRFKTSLVCAIHISIPIN